MKFSSKLKIYAIGAAIGSGAMITALVTSSTGVSQSVEVGGTNMYKAIRVQNNARTGTLTVDSTSSMSGQVDAPSFTTTGGAAACAYTMEQGAYLCSTSSTNGITFDGTSWVANQPFSPTTLTPTAASGAAAMTVTSGARIYVDATRYISGGATIDFNGGSAQCTSGFVTNNAFTSNATSGNQFVCGGAAACNMRSASGQSATVDCGGGTCTASLGASAATTTTVGRSGQTTNINGNVTFGTAGPNLGSTLTGSWGVYAAGLLTATTNYGAFSFGQSATNVTFGAVTCTHAVAGTSTAATLAVRNVTDSTTLCSGSYTCTTAANTPTLIFTCAQTPLKDKIYALQFTTGCGGNQVSGLNCSIEIAH